ncbi:phenylalanine ammonia-lyase class 1-like [Pyrus ussuriensis x Pyrus communis]|uniref:Phenylalanine ammonia-lyase class 1-like n=1 Tax=Pyrus ussuriensis x Pyrus communis TaxID=2448454 RepID=A0A5N5IF78_9ROSA|nr:phenylalanine ammonia-lyase class 1-like [Pyrus ussuriensis x Pyrus communis]
MAPFPFWILGIYTPSPEGVDGARSLDFLSFPAHGVAPFPIKERWSNPPYTGGMGRVLTPGYLPMYHGNLIWSLWCLHHLTFFVTAWFWAFSCPLCAWYRLRSRNVATGIGVASLDLHIWHFFPAPCGGFSWFCPLVVFTISAVYATGEAMVRVIRFLCEVTFEPLQLGFSIWAPM